MLSKHNTLYNFDECKCTGYLNKIHFHMKIKGEECHLQFTLNIQISNFLLIDNIITIMSANK
jgi:hypothetical protein